MFVAAYATMWVSDEPQPGLVQITMADAHGRQWTFVDKSPVFGFSLSRETAYPVEVGLACTILSRHIGGNGRGVAVISTEAPWGLASVDGVTRFTIYADQLIASRPDTTPGLEE